MSQGVNNQDMAYFGARGTRTLLTSNLARGVVAFSKLKASTPLGVTGESVVEDAIMVAYQHRALKCDLFLEDTHVPVPGQSEDRCTVYDYRGRWSCEIKTAYEATNFYVPRAVLDAVSTAPKGSGDLRLKPGQSLDDAVVRGLAAALAPAFASAKRPNVLFLDHLGWAFAAHCASAFLEGGTAAQPPGGLAPWQERLTKELIDERLDGELRLADLAAACGLSVSHFARAFRKSTSLPPHRWLNQRRIERAQHLLLTSGRTLADVALECGFHDQSHFTHAFTRQVGASPAAWARTRRA